MDNQYIMQYSTEFADFVLSQGVTDDEELASFDVMSLSLPFLES